MKLAIGLLAAFLWAIAFAILWIIPGGSCGPSHARSGSWRRCCCGGGCGIYSDQFDDEDATPDGWSELVGDWEETGGFLVTEDDPAVIATTATAPVDTHSVRAYVQFNVSEFATGNWAGLAIGVVDDDNLWWVKATTSELSGVLQLYERTTGTDTLRAEIIVDWLTTAYAFEVAIQLELCFSTTEADAPVGSFLASVSSTDEGAFAPDPYSVSYQGSLDPAEKAAGLLAGAVTGSVSFDFFEFMLHRNQDSRCPSCLGCVTCTDGLAPSFVQVEISGIPDVGEFDIGYLDSDCSGGGCDVYNSTYILPRVASCCWLLLLESTETDCDPYHGILYTVESFTNVVALYGPSTMIGIDQACHGSPSDMSLVWKSDSFDPDCAEWDELACDSFAAISSEPGTRDPACDNAGTTALVTSLT